MMSISPVMSRLAKSTASRFCSIATSRMLGLTKGRPPNFSIRRAISAALRLSSAATRRLAKLDCGVVIVQDAAWVFSEQDTAWSAKTRARLAHRDANSDQADDSHANCERKE